MYRLFSRDYNRDCRGAHGIVEQFLVPGTGKDRSFRVDTFFMVDATTLRENPMAPNTKPERKRPSLRSFGINY